MSTDITGGQARRIKPDDPIIYPVDPGLAFLDQLRLETAIHCPAVETQFR
jgi:hypothetical protein